MCFFSFENGESNAFTGFFILLIFQVVLHLRKGLQFVTCSLNKNNYGLLICVVKRHSCIQIFVLYLHCHNRRTYKMPSAAYRDYNGAYSKYLDIVKFCSSLQLP